MIRTLTSKDESKFIYFCTTNTDQYNDFYITVDNERRFMSSYKVAKRVFNSCLKHGDICYVKEENGEIEGVLLIVGYSDKSPRKYIKILTKNKKVAEGLIKYLDWNYNKDIYLKLNNKNPLTNVFKDKGFIFIGGRGTQILLARNKNGHNSKNNQKSYRRPTSKRWS